MDELLEVAKSQGPVVLLLVLIIIGGSRAVWVWGWQYREEITSAAKDLLAMTQERDFWRTAALRGLGTVEKAVNLVERQIQPPTQAPPP